MDNRVIKTALYILAGIIFMSALGYIIGALIGVIITWFNNTLSGRIHGSYNFWPNFTGKIVSILVGPTGIIVGLNLGLRKSKKVSHLTNHSTGPHARS